MLPCNFISKEADKNKLLNLSETAQNQLSLKLDLKYLVLIRMVSLFHGVSFTLIILLCYRCSTRVTTSLTVDFGKFRLNYSVKMLLTILHGAEINEMFENFCRSSCAKVPPCRTSFTRIYSDVQRLRSEVNCLNGTDHPDGYYIGMVTFS